jgi:hypothetical protein
VELVTEAFNAPVSKLAPTIRELDPGTIEISVSLTGETALVGRLLFLGYLGHGVYL